VAIVDRYWIVFRQGPGCGIARNSRSDNRDAHSGPPSVDVRDTARCSRSFTSRSMARGNDGLVQANHRRAALNLRKIAFFPDGEDLQNAGGTPKNVAVPAAHQRPHPHHGGDRRLNRTVRAAIPQLVWPSGSRGSITPVNVSQAVSAQASSANRFGGSRCVAGRAFRSAEG
ncbi:MAG: hypothetical protein QOF22_1795, partial [Bradyrhizobium sp.]|nr:hypothetical protein [Bradyrhizobium sp.]